MKKFIIILLLLLMPLVQGCVSLGTLISAGASYALWKLIND